MSWAEGRRRSICKRVTYTPEEWAQAESLYRLAAGPFGCRTFGAFARAMTMTGEVRTVTVAADPAAIRGDVRRIGQNINQIVHAAHASGTVTPEQMEDVGQELRRLNDRFDRLMDDWADATGDA